MADSIHGRPRAEQWVAGWTQAVTDLGGGSVVRDVTLQIQVRLELTGTAIRFVLSNRFGREPVLIGEAAISFAGRSAPIAFAGRQSGTIPAGGELSTDAWATETGATGDAVLRLYLPQTTALSSGNTAGAPWSLSTAGNQVNVADDTPLVSPTVSGPGGEVYTMPTPLIRAVETLGSEVEAAVVCLGDSITAAGWPNLASAALADEKVVLLNRGIPGNRLLRHGAGPSGMFFGRSGRERFAHDVIDTSGVTHAVIALGTNDLGHPGSSAAPLEEVPTASELIDAMDLLVQRCRSAGITPVLATITPFLPAAGYDVDRDQRRQEVNEWIRAASAAMPILDFDLVLRSTSNPLQLADEFDSGDHLHPNAAGQSRLAQECSRVFV